MIGYVKFRRDDGDKNRTTYHCSRCGTFITHSGAVTRLHGSENHSFVNPAGVLCNFLTFSHCENVLEHEELYVQHSWFAGYGWRFLMCRSCFQHLGWKYDAVKAGLNPRSFFGLLVEAVEPAQPPT